MKFPMLRAALVGVKFGGGTSARILAAIGSMQPAGIWFPGKGLPAPTQSPTRSTIVKKPVHGEDDELQGLMVNVIVVYSAAASTDIKSKRSVAIVSGQCASDVRLSRV